MYAALGRARRNQGHGFAGFPSRPRPASRETPAHARATAFAVRSRQCGIFDLSTSRPMIRDLFLGLRHIHCNGILHRDIKPDNLLLQYTVSGTVLKITDWGWARFLSGGGEAELTPGCCSGAYRPPEVWANLTYSDKVDVWAAGLIAYELYSGTRWRELMESAESWRQLAVWQSEPPHSADPVIEMPALHRELSRERPAEMAEKRMRRPGPTHDGAEKFFSGVLCICPSERWRAPETLRSQFLSDLLAPVRAKSKMQTPYRLTGQQRTGQQLAGWNGGVRQKEAKTGHTDSQNNKNSPGIPGPCSAKRRLASTSRPSEQPLCMCHSGCGTRGVHSYQRAPGGGRHTQQCSQPPVPGFDYCEHCKCSVDECRSCRLRGPYCAQHRSRELPLEHQLVAQFASVMPLPLDLEAYTKTVPLQTPLVAILAAHLWEPWAVQSFTQACRGDASPAALLRGLRAACAASAQDRSTERHSRIIWEKRSH